MKNNGKRALIVVAALVCIVIGFVIGQVVQAMSTLPGTSDDPVATQSYVEATIGERLAVLTTKVDELEAEIAALKGGGTATSGGDKTPADKDDTQTPAKTEQVEITGNSVNVRETASTSGKKLTSLSKGTVVTLLEEDGDWYKVKTSGGTVGYVSSDYAKKK